MGEGKDKHASHTSKNGTALVNKEESLKFNLASLKRIDKDVEEIIGTANHVSLYQFQLDSKSWKRKDVEGSLFVVKRNTIPRFQFIILNRLSPKNFVEDLLDSVDFERQAPYVIYKNKMHEVLGIWFYEEKDSSSIFKLFKRISNTYNLDRDENAEGISESILSSLKMAQVPSAAIQSSSDSQNISKGPRADQNSKSKAAEDISDLLGLLNSGTSTSLENIASDMDAMNRQSKSLPSEFRQGLVTSDHLEESAVPANSVTDVLLDGEIVVTKENLRNALERVVKSDSFIDMIYNELKNNK